ncbi:uncharacterized protein [Lepeophtheirus salmonis]|uniref:uncharacterized protein n=1 Tax=Lepeophtheirus salmonis TaxID=72036 RepID=UPI001AE4D971|nr:uncharacterized protein LOC121123485 [Lepeophtheirus salmonis]
MQKKFSRMNLCQCFRVIQKEWILICVILFLILFNTIRKYTYIDMDKVSLNYIISGGNTTNRLLEAKINKIKYICGDACDTSMPMGNSLQQDRIYFLSKSFDCKEMFRAEGFDSKILITPPVRIPPSLYSYFTYQNQIIIRNYYLNNAGQSATNRATTWSRIYVNKLVETYKKYGVGPKFYGSYGIDETKRLDFALKTQTNITGKRVLVVGSMSPWVECMALANGAAMVTTLEYGKIISQHEKLRTLIPSEYEKLFLENKLEPFDIILSFSSLEHSGLGRYGDALNPWGDIITMAKLHCTTTRDAVAIIGLPYDTTGKDSIEFNAHRCYGPLMLSHIFTNWKLKWLSEPKYEDHPCSFHKYHGIYVVQKA